MLSLSFVCGREGDSNCDTVRKENDSQVATDASFCSPRLLVSCLLCIYLCIVFSLQDATAEG